MQRLLRELGQWLTGLGSLGAGCSIFYHLPLLLPLLPQLALLLLQAERSERGSAGGIFSAAGIAKHHVGTAVAAGMRHAQVRQQVVMPVLICHWPQPPDGVLRKGQGQQQVKRTQA